MAKKTESAPEEPIAPANRAVQSGQVTCRVVGPGPMHSEEGVKAKGETFCCSAKRAAAYGKLVEIVK